jgi:hypothetical protein
MGIEENFKGKGKIHQFSSTNQPPKGSTGPKKGKRLTTILKEMLQKDAGTINPALKGLKTNEALMLEILNIALREDSETKNKLAAIKDIFDRVDGKAKQEVEQTINTIKPLDFKIIK